MAALSRMANNDHSIRVGEGDTVLLASSLIPGNENAVYRVINGLSRLGAKVVHKGNALVHVSGHAAAGELTYCYNIVKPRNVMPVHGEWRHLRANGDLAVRTGVPRERVVLAEDGSVVDLVDGRGVDRRRGALRLRLRRRQLGRRRHRDLAEGPPDPAARRGSSPCVVVVDLTDGKVVGGPEIHARGFAEDDRSSTRYAPASPPPSRTRCARASPTRFELQQVMRRAVGRWVSDTHRRRPMIIPVVVEV